MKTTVKYIISVLILSVALFTNASAQQNLRTAYFLDGYTYNYKLNPAFAPERPFVALPLLGNIGIGVESNMGLSTFLYPTSDGKLTTFLNKSVGDDQFLNNLKSNERSDKHISISAVLDANLSGHLSCDDFNVLIVYVNRLRTVGLLDFLYDILVNCG